MCYLPLAWVDPYVMCQWNDVLVMRSGSTVAAAGTSEHTMRSVIVTSNTTKHHIYIFTQHTTTIYLTQDNGYNMWQYIAQLINIKFPATKWIFPPRYLYFYLA
ncbi:unnamed protein product [Meganyctiphanes norvegica]|uniref:Uncharacterized protein n=1 Tax=Meganyctiphanes norvegica TaxID=48144 RepID=A0AAV2Q2P7_MEGNR